MRNLYFFFTAILFCTAFHSAEAQGPPTGRRFLIDFGDPATPTTITGWNNVTSVMAGQVINLVESAGVTSTLNLEVVTEPSGTYAAGGDFNTQGYNGTVLDYPASACRDSHYAWQTGGTYKINGLDNTKVYNLRIFANRSPVSDARVGTYIINGQQLTLNAANNTTQTIEFTSIAPTNGTITLNFGVGAGSTFGYLGVLDIREFVNGSSPLLINGSVANINTVGGTGGIALNVTGGATPYTYSWSSGETASSITNKSFGTYTVTVTDNAGSTASRTFQIAYSTLWQQESGITISNGMLTKTGANGWGGAGAVSSNTLPPNTDGWVEFVSNTVGVYIIGLSSSANAYGREDVNFGINAEGNGDLATYELWIKTVLGTYLSGDVYRISREGSQVKYYRNGTLIRTVSANALAELMIKAVLFSGSTPVVTSSLLPAPQLRLKGNVSGIETVNGKGGISMEVAGGTTPYSYSWSSGEATSAITNKTAGTYTVTVTDANNTTATRSYQLGYKVFWKNPTGATESNGIIYGPTTIDYAWDNGAYSSNMLAANTDGWVEFIAGEGGSYVVGLGVSGGDFNYSSLNNGVRLDPSGTVVLYEQWVSTDMGTYKPGDVFRVSRQGNQVIYYKNGTAIRTVSTNPSLVLWGKAVVQLGNVPKVVSKFWIDPSEGQIPDNLEFNVLKNVYDSLGGASWTNKTNWPTGTWPSSATSAQFGTWNGITVENGDVTSCSMPFNNLTGQLPATLSKLTALKTINFQSNAIGGTFPKSICSLIGLTTLNIFGNQINGIIPTEIANLTHLTVLALGPNNFTGNLPNLGNLTSLKTLNVSVLALTPGPIPAWVENLTQLEQLSFTNSRRTGSIPSFLGNLSLLQILYLDTNQLTGSIPSSFGNLTNLTSLTIIENQLTGNIPSELGNLTNLVSLQLHSNQLSGSIPPSFSNLTNLTSLFLNNNQLSGTISPSLQSLAQLQYLYVNNNQFSGAFPNEIKNIPTLKILLIHSNNFNSFPDFSQHPNKQNLAVNISDNKISFESIEPNVGQLATFTYAPQKTIDDFSLIDFVVSNLTVGARNPGSSSTIIWEKQQPGGSWTNVNALNQDATLRTFARTTPSSSDAGIYRWSMTNSIAGGLTIQSAPISVTFSGGVPDHVEFLALKSLYENSVGATWTTKTNWPTGAWPTSATSSQFGTWYGVTVTNGDITEIKLDNNNLTETLTLSISNMTSLTKLNLSFNHITGTIPASVNDLSNLTELSLAFNAFSGTIPDLHSLSHLKTLNLGNNSYQYQPFVDWIVNLTALTHLEINNCNLYGQLPSAFQNLTSLAHLDLSNNNLSGAIPTWIGNLTSLGSLTLSGNAFTGAIPESIGNLHNLNYLNISYVGNMGGPIPLSIVNLTNLQYLFLNHTQLTGNIPNALGNLTNLVYLDLSSNQLTGIIPSSIGQLNNLQYLALTENQLGGSIPGNIGHQSNIRYLYLYNNQLSGELPTSLGDLTTLAYLRLENNKLTGNLPDLSRLALLAQFIIHHNEFNGPLLSSNFSSGMIDFQIGQNQFSGPFMDITQWTNLSHLGIEDNNFSGDFPSVAGLNHLGSIYAGNNNFSSLPVSMLTLPLLTNIYFPSNALTNLPDFASQVDKANLSLNISGNYLDFYLLEPLIDAGVHVVNYNAQKTIPVEPITLVENSPLIITASPTGSFSNVTWEKQNSSGSWIILSNDQDSNLQTYTRNSATPLDGGVYRWSMTNSKVTGMTLRSEPIQARTSTQFALNNLAFQYKYDERKRMTHKKVPGAEWEYLVYDNRNRLVMSQDGEQRKDKQWEFTRYDALNRPIMTGIYTHNVALDQHQMSLLISNSIFYETSNTDESTHLYTRNMFAAPAFIEANFKPLTVTYYDNYDFQSGWGNNYNYYPNDVSNQTVNGVQYVQPASAFDRVKGLVTGKKIMNLDDDSFLLSVNYYDDRLRLVQSIHGNHKQGIDRVTSLYDFTGQVLAAKTTHTVSGGSAQTVTRTFDYDHGGRLMNTWHKVNNQPTILLAHNEYNELGLLVDKKLHSTNSSASDAKQSIDYRYNIRGWLTSINNSQLATNDTNDDTGDLFGMELGYNKTLSGLGNAHLFNGNISAIKWSENMGLGIAALGVPTERGYVYTYDKLNRLTAAAHHQNIGLWTPVSSFAEDNIDYDRNGNIKHLNRKGAGGASIDALEYIYGEDGNAGNQLTKMIDHQANPKGFMDGVNNDDDYTYDDNGNLIADNNKGISSIEYNHLNLPSVVTKISNERIKFIYNATGAKLRQEVYNASGDLQKSTDYLGEFLYEDNALQLINHDEGRVVMTGSQPEYQYHHKDHLGNVRLTFTTKEDIQNETATMETANEQTELGQFLNYNEAIKINYPMFDHTNQGATHYSTRLTGVATEREGLAKSLSVMPGDRIEAEVWAKYLDPDENNVNEALTNFLLSMLPGGGAPGGTFIDGGFAGSLGNEVFPYPGVLVRENDEGTGPKAYLNYLVFDRNYRKLDGGFVRVTTNARETGHSGIEGVNHQPLRFSGDEIVIKEAGYVYIWISNENETPVEVYFDDFKVKHIKSPIVQKDDYYPFGLTFNSYQREDSELNKFKFQGQEHVDDLGVNWDSFRWRNHQPDIGRFFNVDPLAEKYFYNSPFAFSENRVINGVEFEGLEVVFINPNKPNNIEQAQIESDKTIVEGAQEIFNSNTLITITAHGGPKAIDNDLLGSKIYNSKQLNTALNQYSEIWKNRKSNEIMTIVFYSCRTGSDVKDKDGNSLAQSFAQRISGSKEFKDVEIIAPDQRVYFRGNGPIGTYKAKYSGPNDAYVPDPNGKINKEMSNAPGNWNVFKNGEIIRSYEGGWSPTNEPDFLDNFLYLKK